MRVLRIAGLCVTILLALGMPAGSAARSPLAYHWPIKPFDRQHPIRGAFGDPRTLSPDQDFGVTGPGSSGKYSFHTGVDIVAKPGTPVYPVVSGRVRLARADEIIVDTGGGHSFQYWHLRGNVRLGQSVVVDRTVLGWIQHPADHVHLTENDGYGAQNPLAPGHLEPYRDNTKPRLIALDFDDGRSPQLTTGGLLSRHDHLVIAAVDEPAMRVPGRFADLPQTPALVEWRLLSGRMWSAWHIAADFRRSEPSPLYFWTVFAPGTYQNVPVFNRELYQGIAGQYLFRIALDPSRLSPGRYELQARAADIRGNSSTTTWPLVVPGS